MRHKLTRRERLQFLDQDLTFSANQLVLRIKQMIHRLRLDTATCLGLTRID